MYLIAYSARWLNNTLVDNCHVVNVIDFVSTSSVCYGCLRMLMVFSGLNAKVLDSVRTPNDNFQIFHSHHVMQPWDVPGNPG